MSTMPPTAMPTPSGFRAASVRADRIDLLTALMIGATRPFPAGRAVRFSPKIAPSSVTRHARTAFGMSRTPQIGRALGENQSGRAGFPPLRLA